MELIEEIKNNEGFSGTVYKDSLEFDTIGYGTKLPLSKDEAELILECRLREKMKVLQLVKPSVLDLPEQKREIIYEMAYQLGVSGVLKFKKMWKALEKKDYNEAAKEMLDSRWAEQTPQRANKLAEKMRL